MKNVYFPVQESLLSQIAQAQMITLAQPFPPLSVPLVNGETKRDGDLELLLPGHLELPPGDAFPSLLSAQGEEKDPRLRSSCGGMKLDPRAIGPFASHWLESSIQQNSQVHLGIDSFMTAKGEPELVTPLQGLGRNGYLQKAVQSIAGYMSKTGQCSFSLGTSVAIKSSHLAQMSMPNFYTHSVWRR